MAHIAVVDDKEILRDSLSTALAREDHSVATFADPVEALAGIEGGAVDVILLDLKMPRLGGVKGGAFDVILLDLKMPRMDGLTFIREIRASGCDTPIIVMTAFATVATAVEAMKLGAFDYVQKPFEADTIAVLIERAIEHSRLRKENEAR